MPYFNTSGQALRNTAGKIVRDVDASKYVQDRWDLPPNAYPPAPSWYADDLRIVDYTDGDFAVGGACAACTGDGATPWDGVFHHLGGAGYHRLIWGGTAYTEPISGKMAAGYIPGGGHWLKLWPQGVTEGHYFWMLIACVNYATYDKWTIWEGRKKICPSLLPTGVYTRVSGCDTTAEVAVEWAT